MAARFRPVNGSLKATLCIAVIGVIALGGESVFAGPSLRASPEASSKAARTPSTQRLRLSLDEAIGLFLRQNLNLSIAKFGIEFGKGQEITARLFPNQAAFLILVVLPVLYELVHQRDAAQDEGE